MLDGRRVLLVVSGGIAAYKSVTLLRRLRQAGARVDVVMTDSAEKMVGATTFEALSGRPVLTDLWSEPLAHIELGREADLAIIAPATANILAKMAHGIADDMASSTLLAADCPLLACPAMNVRMWSHSATQANVQALADRGVRIMGPEEGELAEGEVGPGRMSEPEDILAAAVRLMRSGSALAGRKIVVTAGPTLAPVDPVRFVGNRSSGRMGLAVASSAWLRGADVVLIAGPTTIVPPRGPQLIRVETSREMLEALQQELADAAVLVMAAAVADFVVADPLEQKIKRGDRDHLEIRLESGPDLLAETRDLRAGVGVFTLGFALETEDPIGNGRRKLESKGIDMVAVNEAGRADRGAEAETNQVVLIDAEGVVENMPLLSKAEVAERLLDHVEGRIS
ncbi:MAG: bifunctional phosphopantothenoylcysteine decarboxylase/phosphopantothenate--cysteine ligase CoaBC [Gemmatimonadetes bacterium]|nr:bifunctional phosphopantothenoylcysteine decarboxylase/phosphopantothenate--cysteine ligase CoaBC [Gemmatimonadota bacterium]NNK49159.1 bifunctional phosphopantothenoylcysteine decarboxylase/phosphopantothenate--cysteine ligase CoaBC [Gemmatimonadota bacterium]